MYATETYVRHEVKELHAMIKDMANDLGGDIRYLNQEIINLSERLSMLETQLENLRQNIVEKLAYLNIIDKKRLLCKCRMKI